MTIDKLKNRYFQLFTLIVYVVIGNSCSLKMDIVILWLRYYVLKTFFQNLVCHLSIPLDKNDQAAGSPVYHLQIAFYCFHICQIKCLCHARFALKFTRDCQRETRGRPSLPFPEN